jgi:soluble lytic murein transglycosylase
MVFAQAEAALNRGQISRYHKLAAQLEDYPLYPYLQYQWLKDHLNQSARVSEFIQRYPASRYAAKLKSAWLVYLARQKQWASFLQHYTTSADTRLNCYYHSAQLHTDNPQDTQAALDGAVALWVVGRSQPSACDALFTALKASERFSDELIWQRFSAAMDSNNTQLASYVAKSLPEAERKTAQLWLNLYRSPERYMPELLKQASHAYAPAMFSQAITRLARSDVYSAIELCNANSDKFALGKHASAALEKVIAVKLAQANDAAAFDRLGELEYADYSSKTWRIRVALAEQNWPRVVTAIEDLGDFSREPEKWQYWLARAYQQTGKILEAQTLFSELADKRDFYGYLAADQLERQYQLSSNPVNVSAQQIDSIKNRQEFSVAAELLALGRENEAKLQWWHALRQLDKHDIPAAAKLAQQWQWHEIPVLTIAKVEYWDDLDVRFPLHFADTINAHAVQYDLDPVILYGLIRRESVFNKDAESPAGARGLMQLMPATAKHVARDLKEPWQGNASLFDPTQNLRYGTYYYQKLVKQFNGNDTLALAAYNAGPNRVKQWLPDAAMPADIWIETIPFSETRDYVTSVLVYAMIYQQRLQTGQLSLQHIVQQVMPLSDVATIN